MTIINRKLLNYLWNASQGQRSRILLSCLSGVTGTLFSLVFIWASKWVIDIATGSAQGSLFNAGLLTSVLLVVQLGCNALDMWLNARMQVETGNALRRRLFARLLRSRWNEMERFHTGDIINRIEQDTSAIVTLLTASIPTVVVTAVQLVAAFLFFCFLDARLPWILVVILPFFLIGSRFYTKRMRQFSRNIRQSDSHIQSVIQESLQHRTVLKTMEQSERHIGKLDTLQGTLRTQVYDRTRFSLWSRMTVSGIFSGSYLVAFLWGAARLSTGSITFGTMTAFLQLVGKVQRPALDLSRLLPSFINAFTAAERLMELENLEEEEKGDALLFTTAPDIRIEHITFAYPTGQGPLFEQFSFVFPAGSSTAVLGETGAGKTTLIRLLLALASPQQGSILLAGDTGTLPVSPLTRCNFVYVPQGNTLFSGSIRDNLLMGNPEASPEAMQKALHTAVADFAFALPQGIDTTISELGGGLSEGQAQRIAIARALLRPGTIFLMDEATSALDRDTSQKLLANLRQNYPGRTFIFITHHPELAEACDRQCRIG